MPTASAQRPLLPRDAWLWVALASVLLLLVRTLGTPLGEPVADDFDHLHHVLFSGSRSWLDGGGSHSFWRPLAYQGYYGLLTRTILAHPAWIAALHLACFTLVVVLLYDTARRHMPGLAAATVASFPLLLESARALVTVPVHFVDLGLIVFSVVAWRAADGGRLVPSLVALLAALLCKETAVATALVLPWLARPAPGASRRMWVLATGALTGAWAVTYLLVRRHLAMTLPHGLESQLSPHLFVEPARYAWAIAGTLRALMSLPMIAEAREGLVFAAALAVLGAAGVVFATSAAARARLAGQRGLALTGLAWFVLASGTLLAVSPVWSPERVVYASLGLGASLALVLSAAHPLLPWALLVVRVAAFALAPGAPAYVTRSVSERGAFVDFERLARLQRLMLEARTTLRHEFPTLPHGAGVAMMHPPFMTDYAAGDRSLQVWYRDSTLRWVHWDQVTVSDARALAGALEFQEATRPQFRRVEPEALRLLFVGSALEHEQHWQAAIDTLVRADALQRDRAAHHFLGRALGMRAWCVGGLGHMLEAEQLARQSLALAPETADGQMTMAVLHNDRGEFAQALAHLDTLLSWYPGYPPALVVRENVFKRRREQGVTHVPVGFQRP